MNRHQIIQTLNHWANRLDEFLWKSDGYAVVPHELLHVLAYRLIRKPCQYQLGDHAVRPLSERNLAEQIFVKLFPLAITGGLAVVAFGLWLVTLPPGPFDPVDYLRNGPRWHIGLMLLIIVFQLHSTVSFWDVRAVIELLAERFRKNH